MSKVNEFNFDLHYVKGTHNETADMLSRMSHVTDTEQIRNLDGTVCYMTNESTTVRKGRRLQGLEPEVAPTSQIIRRKRRAKSIQADHSSVQPVTIEPQENYTPSIPKYPTIIPQLKSPEAPESYKMHLDSTETVDVSNSQRFGHERELYTPTPQGPLHNSQTTFSDKFHGSVPHRVRNKMRDLTSKSYSLDIDKETIRSEQKSDPTFRDLYNFLKFKHIPLQKHIYRGVMNQTDHFDLVDDLLYKLSNASCLHDTRKSNLRIVIPESLANTVIANQHNNLDGSGHCGFVRTQCNIKSEYYIHNLANLLKEYMSTCGTCLRFRQSKVKPTLPLKITAAKSCTQPFEILQVDHCGPFKSSKYRYEHILVVVDEFSQYTWLMPTKTTDAVDAANATV